MIAPVDVTNIRIETNRLILRPWRQTDLDDLYAYAYLLKQHGFTVERQSYVYTYKTGRQRASRNV